MSWREELHPRDPRNGEFVEDWLGRISFDAGASGAMRGSRAYDSVGRRVEWDGLLHGGTPEMQAAIADYNRHYDEVTNAHLRELPGPDSVRMADWGLPRIATTPERIALLDSAMTPLAHPIVVYRGIGDPDAWLARGHEPGYLSTSAEEESAQHFANATEAGAKVRLLVPAGVGAVGVSVDELEILLERGLRYRGMRLSDGSIDAEILP